MMEIEQPVNNIKQDIDLIEILWRQDMDLGVGREMYDLTLRKEKEKEKELELQKVTEKEKEWEMKAKEEDAEDDDVQNYMIDGETGELVLAPESNTLSSATSQDDFPETGTGLDENDGLSVEEAMQLLEEQMQETESTQNTSSAQEVPMFNTDNNPGLQAQIEAMIQAAQDYNQNTTSSPTNGSSFERQNLFEQRWEEVENLLHIPADQTNHTYPQQNFTLDNSTSGPLMQNASLAPPASVPPDTFGQLNQSLTSPQPVPLDTSAPVAENSSSMLFGLNSQNYTLPNISVNQADNFLDQLLADDDFMDISLSDMGLSAGMQPMDDASSDSAVSSLGASASPTLEACDNLSLSNYGSSEPASPFDGVEGATGGGYDNDSKQPTKMEPYESQYDYPFQSPTQHTNQSENLNASSFGDVKQVKHNHTYPLKPGQQPRERSSDKREKEWTTRDEKRIKQLKVPIALEDIVNSPVEEFNEILRNHTLSEAQLQLIRDIRRRGKNKVAAQNCRKRKLEILTTLEDELSDLAGEKDRLLKERAEIDKQRREMNDKFSHLYQEVFSSLRDDNGHPYDPNEYTLQQTGDGNVFLVPKNTTKMVGNHKEKSSRKRKSKKEN